MSKLQVDTIVNNNDNGAPTFTKGAVVTGVITATSFSGNGSGLTGAGIGTTGSVNTSGIITATSFFGSGANLTGVSGVSTTGSVNTSGIITATSIVVSAGTTALPSISPTGDSNTGIFFPSADTIAFAEGGAEAMRVDSSGRLLVGTSTGNYGIQTPFGGTGFYNAGSIGGITLGSSGSNYPSIGYNVRFSSTNDTYTYSGADFASRIQFGNNSGRIQTFTAASGTGTLTFTDGPYVANLGASWTNSSDERLKTDLLPVDDAFNKVATLRAVTGRYKTDNENKRRSFLIAQDVQAVFPEAVDATNPENLGVSYTDVIPLLVAALKESKERIEQLEAAVATLQGS